MYNHYNSNTNLCQGFSHTIVELTTHVVLEILFTGTYGVPRPPPPVIMCENTCVCSHSHPWEYKDALWQSILRWQASSRWAAKDRSLILSCYVSHKMLDFRSNSIGNILHRVLEISYGYNKHKVLKDSTHQLKCRASVEPLLASQWLLDSGIKKMRLMGLLQILELYFKCKLGC